MRLHLVNRYAVQIGNPVLPARFQRGSKGSVKAATAEIEKKSKLLPLALVVLGILLVCLLIVGLIFAPALL